MRARLRPAPSRGRPHLFRKVSCFTPKFCGRRHHAAYRRRDAPVVKARVEPAMKTAATALGAILLAAIAIPDQVRSAGSRRHEARPNAGQGSPQAPRSGAVWWIGAPSALWRLPACCRRGHCTIMLAVYVALQLGSVVLAIAISHKPAATSGSVMALENAPKLPIDITEAF